MFMIRFTRILPEPIKEGCRDLTYNGMYDCLNSGEFLIKNEPIIYNKLYGYEVDDKLDISYPAYINKVEDLKVELKPNTKIQVILFPDNGISESRIIHG